MGVLVPRSEAAGVDEGRRVHLRTPLQGEVRDSHWWPQRFGCGLRLCYS